MSRLGRNPTEAEARAYRLLDPTDVIDANGSVVGYFAGRYYPRAEYEQVRPEAEAAVRRAEAEGAAAHTGR